MGGLILILISTLIINCKTFILLISQHFMTAGNRSFDHFNLNDPNVYMCGVFVCWECCVTIGERRENL